MAILIGTDGIITPIEPKNKRNFSLRELQDYVEGYIEIIRLPNHNIMVVNEEGRLRRLKVNPHASLVAQQAIVGNAVLCNDSQIK